MTPTWLSSEPRPCVTVGTHAGRLCIPVTDTPADASVVFDEVVEATVPPVATTLTWCDDMRGHVATMMRDSRQARVVVGDADFLRLVEQASEKTGRPCRRPCLQHVLGHEVFHAAHPRGTEAEADQWPLELGKRLGWDVALLGEIAALNEDQHGGLAGNTRPWSCLGAPDQEAILRSLHPSIRVLAVELLRRRPELILVSGFRSMAEQERLYAMGRTAPGEIVTNAPPGRSWHNYGLAFDVSNPSETAGRTGETLGLTWGGRFRSFPDPNHFEYHPGLTLDDAAAGARPPVPERGKSTGRWAAFAIGAGLAFGAGKLLGWL